MVISDAQAGGKQGRSTVDHILVIKQLIRNAKALKKPIYLPFFDVSKAYDKASFEAILFSAHERGLNGNNWQLMKELNTNLTAQVRTKFGNTRDIIIGGVLKQGSADACLLYAGHIDDITPPLERENLGIVVNNEGETIPALLWVDDIVGAETEPLKVQTILNIIDDLASMYRIEFGEDKSKIMVVGGNANTPRPDFFMGDMKLEYCESYKYLGEHLNSKNNMDDHIKETKRKVEAAYQTILTVSHDRNFRGIQLETIWKLLETSVQSIILYASETWEPTKLEFRKLNSIYEAIIKRILMTPVTTPREALFLETGLLDIEHLSYVKRINMYVRLSKNPSDLHKKILKGQGDNWWSRTEKIMQRFEIGLDILNMPVNKGKELIKCQIRKHFFYTILDAYETKSKIRYLIDNAKGDLFYRKPYLQKLSRRDASVIFKTRCRMTKVKMNYKGKKQNLTCRLCGLVEETQDHVLFGCSKNNLDPNITLIKENVFEENDIQSLRRTASALNKILKPFQDQSI